jgi:hypothetical protein
MAPQRRGLGLATEKAALGFLMGRVHFYDTCLSDISAEIATYLKYLCCKEY